MTSARNSQVLGLKLGNKHLPGRLTEYINVFVRWLTGFAKFNELYSELPPCEALDFSRTFLDALRVHIAFTGQPRSTIPATGPLIVVANHPFGLIDGMVLDTLLTLVRSDVTVMAVYTLAAIPECRDRLIFVGSQWNRRRRNISARGWRQSFQWLAHGGALVVFPAGRVARFHWRRLSVADEPWSSHIAALARRTGAPVLPVYLHGRSNWGFQLAGILFPLLQNLRALGDVASHRGRTLHAVIGRLIQPDDLSHFATDEEATDFLRNETEMLAQSLRRDLDAGPEESCVPLDHI